MHSSSIEQLRDYHRRRRDQEKHSARRAGSRVAADRHLGLLRLHDLLYREMALALAAVADAATQAPDATGDTRLPLRILLVDQNADTRAALEDALTHDRYAAVFGCADGAHAARLIRAQHRDFDLVLIDAALDDRGVATVRAIARATAAPGLPVIVLCESDAARDAYRAAGAIGVIAEPCVPSALRQEIDRLLDRQDAPTDGRVR